MAGSTREDWVDEADQIPDGYLLDGPTTYIDDDELEDRIREWVYVLRRVGGVINIGAVRKELAPGVVITEGYGFRWDSYGGRLQKADRPDPRQRQPEPGPDEPESVVDDVDGVPDDHRVPAGAVLDGDA